MTAQELKNSILQLAVQGKLVPQCKEDEPASELLKRIEQEKSTLIKAGIIKKYKELSTLSADDCPFDIPESWIWMKLGDMCQLLDGIKRRGEKHPYLEAKYLRGKVDATILNEGKFVEKGTRLILVDGENSGEVFNSTQDGYMGSTFKVLFFPQVLSEEYVLYFLLFKRTAFRNNKTGAAIPHLNKELFFNMPFPIPPLAEQERIVAKIEELMPLVEEYGKAEEQLTKLNAEFPDKLRKSILQQAVQGKLTERDPADEPASELIKRIKTEKEALIKSGKIKKEKPLPEITEDEKPFDIPDTWEWSNINSLFWVTKLAGFEYTKFFTKETISPDNEVHIVRAQHVKMNRFIENDNEAIPIDLSLQLERSALTTECLLMTFIGAGIGDTCIYNSAIRHHLAPNVAKIVPQTQGIYLPYYLIWLMSPAGQANVEAIKKSTAQPSLSMETIRSIQVAVPPLTEQKRIVKRVDELLALCNELK